MAGNQQDQDRSEQATPFKIKEARKQGQVVKSLEMNSWLIMLAILAIATIAGEKLIQNHAKLFSALFNHSGTISLSVNNALVLAKQVGSSLLSYNGLFVGFILILGIGVNMLQIGPIFTLEPLKPNLNRLNPVEGFKRLFSIKLIFELIKTLIKLTIIIGVVAWSIRDMMTLFFDLFGVESKLYPMIAFQQTLTLAFKILMALCLIAIIDLVYMRWDYSKNLRMSKRDVKEEVKRREGDPRVRARMKELQREAAKRGASLQKTKEADVLITNPTHLSIALKYDQQTMQAPMVIAKASGAMAQHMRIIAGREGIFIVENKPLARLLYREVEIEQPIAASHFPAVAKILLWVYAQRKLKNS